MKASQTRRSEPTGAEPELQEVSRPGLSRDFLGKDDRTAATIVIDVDLSAGLSVLHSEFEKPNTYACPPTTRADPLPGALTDQLDSSESKPPFATICDLALNP